MVAYLRMIWTVFCFHFKQVAVDSFVIFTVIIQPLLVALVAIYMLRNSENFQAVYAIVGSAVTGLWGGTIYITASSVADERGNGMLEQILGSPTNLQSLILGKSLANTIMSLSSMLISYPVATILLGYRLTIAEPFSFAVSLLLTIVALVSFGMMVAPVLALNLRAYLWPNVFEWWGNILGCFLFPILLLPAWVTPLSYVFAPYWAARALHATSSGGASAMDVLINWGILLLLSVMYWFISAWLFRILLRRARVEATLGVH